MSNASASATVTKTKAFQINKINTDSSIFDRESPTKISIKKVSQLEESTVKLTGK